MYIYVCIYNTYVYIIYCGLDYSLYKYILLFQDTKDCCERDKMFLTGHGLTCHDRFTTHNLHNFEFFASAELSEKHIIRMMLNDCLRNKMSKSSFRVSHRRASVLYGIQHGVWCKCIFWIPILLETPTNQCCSTGFSHRVVDSKVVQFNADQGWKSFPRSSGYQLMVTPPKFNIEPENEVSKRNVLFQGFHVQLPC